LLILLKILKDYAGRYDEHFCKFSLQPTEYKYVIVCYETTVST